MLPVDSGVDSFLRAVASAPFVSLPGQFSGTERFELVRALGEGGFGRVYEAIDHRHGGRLALKVLRRSDGLYRFKHEFRSLAEVVHPNLVRLYELVAVDESWFFTMELIDGVPLNERVAAAPERLRADFLQLAEGVAALHRAGILHCDIKPSNVLVDRNGRVVVLDFGLAVERDTSNSGELAGTPLYMSPEQCAAGQLGEASDWYAVGLMLYEALAGELPFVGTQRSLFNAKQGGAPRSPGELRPGLPDDLVSLCLALLARDPEARPSGAEVLSRLRGDDSQPHRIAARQSFVGRSDELAVLHAQLDDMLRGRRTVTFLRGPSGIGKSALLRRFLDEVQRRNPELLVLSGRCYEHESVPYKALDPIVDELARFLGALPDAEARELAPADSASLIELFPVLRRVPALARWREGRPRMEPAARKRRGAAALRELIVKLAARRPMVIAVDDLHWGDIDSAGLLADLVRPPDPPSVCFVGSFRGEEAATSPLLQHLAQLRISTLAEVPLREIVLGEMPEAEAQALAALLLDELDADAGRAAGIAVESKGSPFFVHELVRGGAAGGAALGELVLRRVSSLPAGVRGLLELVAVAGQPIDEELIGEAARLDPRDPLAALRAERLVRGRETAGRHQVECYHDRIREAVVHGLGDEARRALHRRLAEAMESRRPLEADAETLSLHWRDAGERERAAGHAVVAAERAAATLAFEREARLYRMALELRAAAEEDDASRRLRARLGTALSNAGRGAEAAGEFLAAAAGAPLAESLDWRRLAADGLLRSGHIDRGVEVLRGLLESAHLYWPTTVRGALVSFLWHRARLMLRGMRSQPREAPAVPPVLLSQIDIAWVVGTGLSFVDPYRSADFQARGLLWALRAGEPSRLARALIATGGFAGFEGEPGEARSLRLHGMAEKLIEGLTDPRERGRLMLMRGVVSYLLGRWPEARTRIEEGDEFVRQHCTGMTWELDSAQVFLTEALYYLGDLPALEKLVTERLRDAEERGDLYAAVSLRVGSSVLAQLGHDDPARAQEESENGIRRWSVAGFHVQHFYDLLGKTNIDLYRRDGAAALARVRERWPALRRSQLLRGQSVRIKCWELSARVLLCTNSDEESLRQVEGWAARIVRERAPWATPLGLLLRAQVAGRRGDQARAVALYDQAIDGFDAAGMRLHSAAARRARGLLLGAESVVAHAEARLAECQIRRPDRFATMLAPG